MIDIVIVNWNSGRYLENCINSLFTTNNIFSVNKIFIIDNHSTDSSLDFNINSEKIVIVRNQENVGFSKACNQGFKICISPFILLLNPDTRLFENTLKDCANFLNERNDVDILGCQLLKDSGEISFSCSHFPSVAGIFRDLSGLSKIAPAVFKPGIIMRDWDHKESRFVDQVMGAFMFMRKSIFQKVGLFDEQFFVYFEEVDFSKRLSEAGGKTFFNANIKAIHSGEGTTSSVKAFRLFLNLQSRLRYSKKHFSFFGHAIVWFSTYFIEPFTRSFFLMLMGKNDEIVELWKGYKFLLTTNESKLKK